MQLVERYLQAVKGYLPPAQQHDIIAELKDDLLSQIEEKEAGLQRALTDAEQKAFIKQSGHPMLVASRYLPQQHLIGPAMYPFWWTSQRIMLFVIAAVYGLLAGVHALSNANPFQAFVQALIQATNSFVGTALFYAAVITIVFWFFERNQVRFGFLANWDPAKLAPVKDKLQIKRSESLFEVVAETIFLLWWVGAISFATSFYHHGKAVPFQMSPAWEPFWWGIFAVSIGGIILAVANLLWPYWTRRRLLMGIVLNVVAIGIAYMLFQQDVLIVVGDASIEIAKFGNAGALLNKFAHGLLVVLALVWSIEIIQYTRKLLAG